jgi:streptogramin lyase
MKRFYWVSLLFLVLLLGACGGAYTAATSPVGPIDTPTPGSQPTTTPSIAASGKFQEFALPQDNSGLMRPAIDHEGRIWFGEMARNYLAVFDPRTGAFRQMTPPRGLSGIMGVEVAADDTIWYAEQYADYIGHYFPATGRYQLYQLPNVTVPDPSNPGKTLTLPSAPNDLAFDAHGNVWFTQLNANALGRLDPSSGSIRQYALSTSQNARPLNTYGITVDPRGAVWFTEASTGHIGRLDPATGAIRYFGPSGMAATFMEIASDARGTIWATSFDTGLLVSLNPGTGVFTRYYAPSPDGNAGGLYGLTTTPTGEVWVIVSAIGIIARLDTTANRFVYYTIPTGGSMPLGIVVGPHHTLWFTETGSDKIGMLQP